MQSFTPKRITWLFFIIVLNLVTALVVLPFAKLPVPNHTNQGNLFGFFYIVLACAILIHGINYVIRKNDKAFFIGMLLTIASLIIWSCLFFNSSFMAMASAGYGMLKYAINL